MVNDEVASVATPLLFSVPVPRTVVPFLKVTVPVGVPVLVDFTVAVKVTVCKNDDGLADEVRAVVVEPPAAFTV